MSVHTVLTAVIVVAAGADEQSLVLFHAVSVFLSFLAGLVAMVASSGSWGRSSSASWAHSSSRSC
jgi:hypothetical protein